MAQRNSWLCSWAALTAHSAAIPRSDDLAHTSKHCLPLALRCLQAIAAKSVQRMAVDRHALYASHNADGKLSCTGSGGDPSRCAIQLH